MVNVSTPHQNPRHQNVTKDTCIQIKLNQKCQKVINTKFTIRGAFNIFCPIAVKARSTTLIFVECITFHQSNLLDDVHKVSPAISYVFGIFLSIPPMYWITADLVLFWHWNYLPERVSCIFGNNKNPQDARYC